MTLNFAGAFSLLGLYLLWIFVYRSYRVDKTRSHLFNLRHQLFMLAAQGAIDFDAPAYRAAERLLNGLIRHTHRMGAIRLLVWFVIAGRSIGNGEAASIYETIRNHKDGVVRKKILHLLETAGLLSFYHITLTFLPTWLLFHIVYHVTTWRLKFKRLAEKRLRNSISVIENEALAG